MKKEFQMPFIHLNGSSLQELQREADTAYHALDEFVGAWSRMAPHPRDYYLAEGAWGSVREERKQLNQKVADLLEYLETLRKYLYDEP